MGDDIAGMMMTNPNTLGLFEKDIPEIAKLIHDCGGLLYYDGANLNPLLGAARPGDMGFDVIHLNLHKTFSTPHGGGGPGAGPVGVGEKLIPFLPKPHVKKTRMVLLLTIQIRQENSHLIIFVLVVTSAISSLFFVPTLIFSHLAKSISRRLDHLQL